MKSIPRTIAVAAAVASLAIGGQTAPLVLDGGWQYGLGAVEYGGWVYDPPQWELICLLPVEIKITDNANNGDFFELWVNGSVVLTTPPAPVGTEWSIDDDYCYSSSNFSHGSVVVGAGNYVIRVRDLLDFQQYPSMSPYSMAIRADTVPEPSGILALLCGVVGLGGLLRKRS